MTDIIFNLKTIELKSFIPAKDFQISLAFYSALGFEILWQDDQLCLFALRDTKFFLQHFYNRELAENTMLHLQVENADDWYHHIQSLNLCETFDCKITAPENREWKMRDFILIDPSGVLWRIGHNI
ncbi:glyoxalase [Myroides sp. 1354]|uniref:VOC family protein n=1 Tax=unclassified Myroides TaxID=2642485 RepID=UPI002574DBC4|nr:MULTISPECIES: VOC family protein [unclassified Myroides]MDM1046301.1 glyoxalase [Myroides sp. R163-1]MDM1057238.1 glyoxalase [Myroides sp. 1354]MDM1070433.1 glyoxalase [Myroides sp. 1372]